MNHKTLILSHYVSPPYITINGFFNIEDPIRLFEGNHTDLVKGDVISFKDRLISSLKGPALLKKGGKQALYFRYGEISRLSGPALIEYDKPLIWKTNHYQADPRAKIIKFEYYLNGDKINEEEFNNHPKVVAHRNVLNKRRVKRKMKEAFD